MALVEVGVAIDQPGQSDRVVEVGAKLRRQRPGRLDRDDAAVFDQQVVSGKLLASAQLRRDKARRRAKLPQREAWPRGQGEEAHSEALTARK